MKQLLAIMALAFVSATAAANPNVTIHRETLGSGTQGVKGFEQALPVLENNIFHAPQYMAAFPTAATIWPRVVEVECMKVGTGLECEGYQWTPKMGRGEYLFFKPMIVEPAPVRERIIIKEVAVKKVRQ